MIVPPGAGCMQFFLWPLVEAEREHPRAVLGMTDPSARVATTKTAPVRLLSGGNPQIAKADGDAPVQAYIAALSGWQHESAKRLDALVERGVIGGQQRLEFHLARLEHGTTLVEERLEGTGRGEGGGRAGLGAVRQQFFEPFRGQVDAPRAQGAAQAAVRLGGVGGGTACRQGLRDFIESNRCRHCAYRTIRTRNRPPTATGQAAPGFPRPA